MAGNQPWDGNIEELGCEILNYNIKETSRSTLKDLGSRLNSDHVSTGNWEALAEKLGYLQVWRHSSVNSCMYLRTVSVKRTKLK